MHYEYIGVYKHMFNALKILKNTNVHKVKNNTGDKELDSLKDSVSCYRDLNNNIKALGKEVAVLELSDIQAFWLKIMMDSKASNKDKLTASKLYAQSLGAFDRRVSSNKSGSAVYSWSSDIVDADVIKADKVQI